MNENIDLTKILKNCPVGTEFYHLIYDKVYFFGIDLKDIDYPIHLSNCKDYMTNITLTENGKHLAGFDGECILFPSKDQRDWSKFTAPWYKKDKFDPKILKPFDRVLARIDGGDVYCWFADFVSTPTIEKYDLLPCIMSNKDANMIIPYNDDTKHLVGTKEEAPEYYRYWED